MKSLKLLAIIAGVSLLAVGCTTPSATESTAEVGSDQYQVYDESKVALAEEGKVVLFFKASWCSTCRALEKDIKNNAADIPEDVTILTLDYDTETELKQQYGVTVQHTLVQVDADGELIQKWTGGNQLSTLLAQVQ